MPYPSWPGAVRYKPLRSDFQIVSPHLPPETTDMNDGSTRMRRRFSSAIGQVRMSIKMPNAEFDQFAPWVRDTLGHGSSRFMLNIYYRTGGWVLKECWFDKGQYSAVPDEAVGYMRVNALVNILDF